MGVVVRHHGEALAVEGQRLVPQEAVEDQDLVAGLELLVRDPQLPAGEVPQAHDVAAYDVAAHDVAAYDVAQSCPSDC